MKSFSKFYSFNTLLAAGVFLAVSVVFQFSSPNIPDPDSFYHMRHAAIYLNDGIFMTDFPWTQYSVIRALGADIWYGFHIFLVPFALFDSILGVKSAGVVLTFFALFALYRVLKELGVAWPWMWTALAFVSAPNIMNRFLMMRPHLVSMALVILLFHFLIKRKNWPTLIISFFISWFHLALSWTSFVVLGVIAVAQLMIEKKIRWQDILAVAGGSALGWLLRPNSFGALRLAYIQVVELMIQKQNEATLLFGRELFPLAPQTLFQNFSAFMLLWLFAAAVFAYKIRPPTLPDSGRLVALLSSGFLSLLFFGLTVLVARRSHDFWIPFGVIFIALVLTPILKSTGKSMMRPAVWFITSAIFLFLIIYTPYRNSVSLEERAVPPDRFKKAALWLKDNSNPGDIVFNARWSDFPMLFFWNQKNYYIGGMDPIFQYAYDPALYWKFHYLSADEVTKKTCGAPACTAAMLEDTHAVLKNDFKAKYVFLEKQRNPLVYYYLESDKDHYQKKIDTVSEAVYEIK